MHSSRKIFLISDDVRAIAVTYEEGDEAPRTTFKSLDPDIKVDDCVVVETGTRHEMTVVKVAAVDVDENLESSSEIKWIVCKLDISSFQDLKAQEAEMLEVARRGEKERKRRQLRADMMEDVGEDIKKLSLYTTEEGDEEKAPETL